MQNLRNFSCCYIVVYDAVFIFARVLADARPRDRSVIVVVVIVLKVRRVSVQQHVPIVIESIKHPKPHHRAETRAQRLVREGGVVQRHALVRHATALARCVDTRARAHQSVIRSFVRVTRSTALARGPRGAPRFGRMNDRSIDRSRSSSSETARTHRNRARRRDARSARRPDAFSTRGAGGRRARRTW
jgi:hypothetical protein